MFDNSPGMLYYSYVGENETETPNDELEQK